MKKRLSDQLQELPLIPTDYASRMDEVMKLAWSIFKAQFINKRHAINTEAPFQHHFAQIIRQVGNLYCLERDDLFHVDLEVQCYDIKGKTKYLDITCAFKGKYSCAIELKYKKESQGAQDHGRIDMYVDIEALELVCTEGRYDTGRFYAITDCTAYVNKSVKGVGTEFATHHGHVTEAGKTYHRESPGRKHVYVTLNKQYEFEWEKYDRSVKAERRYFLSVPISQV